MYSGSGISRGPPNLVALGDGPRLMPGPEYIMPCLTPALAMPTPAAPDEPQNCFRFFLF